MFIVSVDEKHAQISKQQERKIRTDVLFVVPEIRTESNQGYKSDQLVG